MPVLLSIPWKGGMHHCFVPLIEWLSKFPSNGSLLLCPGSQLLLSAFLLPGGNLAQISLCFLYLSFLYFSPKSKLKRHPP